MHFGAKGKNMPSNIELLKLFSHEYSVKIIPDGTHNLAGINLERE